jgi:NAD(P)H-hydrate epimerase
MYGHVLVVAGSLRYSGAALLCVSGALRSGAGLVTLGLPESLCRPVLGKKPPDAMLLPLAETGKASLSLKALGEIRDFMAAADVLAIGPGLGNDASSGELCRALLASEAKPAVVDASALDAFKGKLKALRQACRQGNRVLTPHPGEMSRLTGMPVKDIQNKRKDIAKDFAYEYNVTVVLKGKDTIVASPAGSLYINRTGNPGMARGGTGDILSGMIAAFIGQGLDCFEAAKYAVYLHGLAGDIAAKKKTQLGMIASDILDTIPGAFKAAG